MWNMWNEEHCLPSLLSAAQMSSTAFTAHAVCAHPNSSSPQLRAAATALFLMPAVSCFFSFSSHALQPMCKWHKCLHSHMLKNGPGWAAQHLPLLCFSAGIVGSVGVPCSAGFGERQLQEALIRLHGTVRFCHSSSVMLLDTEVGRIFWLLRQRDHGAKLGPAVWCALWISVSGVCSSNWLISGIWFTTQVTLVLCMVNECTELVIMRRGCFLPDAWSASPLLQQQEGEPDYSGKLMLILFPRFFLKSDIPIWICHC